MGNQRQQLTQEQVQDALGELTVKTAARLRQKGMGVMASSHEILGIVHDEVVEYRDAVHGRLSKDAKVQELLDIAVGCIVGIASIRSGGTDW